MLNRIILVVFIILVVISALYALRDTREYTTSSDEAYSLFQEGKDLISKLYMREGIEKLQEAVKIDSNFAMAHIFLAEQLGRYADHKSQEYHIDKALENYDKLKEHEKLYVDYIRFAFEKKMDSAIATMNQYVKEFPDRTAGHLALGTIAWEDGEIEKAISEFEKITKIDPNYAPVYNNLGYLEFGRGNYQKALNYFEDYRKLLPDQANPYDSKGEILLAIGRYDEALKAFKTAHQIEPRFSFVLYHMAQAYSSLGQFIKAHQSLDKIAQLCQDYRERRELAINRGQIYWSQGDLEMTHKICDSLLNMGQNNDDTTAIIWSNLGQAMTYAETDVDSAEIYLNRANELLSTRTKSKNGDILVDNLTLWKYFSEAQINRFKKDYEKLLDLESVLADKHLWRPDMTINIRNLLALGRYYTGSKQKAFDLLEESREINPNHIHTLFISALLNHEENNQQNAINNLEKILKINNRADSTYYRMQKIRELYEKWLKENQAA